MAFRFCLIVCLVAPPITWGATGVPGADAGCSAVGTPGGAQIVRETAKTNKTFSTSWLATAYAVVLHLSTPVINEHVRQNDTASSLSLDSPPLAPRPPPQA
jgi:hypothetical protein